MAPLGNMPDPARHDLVGLEVGNILFLKKDPPLGRLQDAGYREQQRGLPRLVRPDEGNHLPLFDLQGDLVEGDKGPIMNNQFFYPKHPCLHRSDMPR